MKEKETNNTQALSEEDLENVSGGYIIHHDRPDDMFYGDTGNQVGKYEDFANFQMLSLEELKKLQEANR